MAPSCSFSLPASCCCPPGSGSEAAAARKGPSCTRSATATRVCSFWHTACCCPELQLICTKQVGNGKQRSQLLERSNRQPYSFQEAAAAAAAALKPGCSADAQRTAPPNWRKHAVAPGSASCAEPARAAGGVRGGAACAAGWRRRTPRSSSPPPPLQSSFAAARPQSRRPRCPSAGSTVNTKGKGGREARRCHSGVWQGSRARGRKQRTGAPQQGKRCAACL